MAIRTITELVDDLDGSEGDVTVAFALEGRSYEIDLNSAHADEMRALFQPYIDKARRTRGMSPDGRRGRASSPASNNSNSGDHEKRQAVRAWAQSQGIAVSDRGRLAQALIDQYEESLRKPVAEKKPVAKKAPAKKAAAKKAPAKKAATTEARETEMTSV